MATSMLEALSLREQPGVASVCVVFSLVLSVTAYIIALRFVTSGKAQSAAPGADAGASSHELALRLHNEHPDCPFCTLD